MKESLVANETSSAVSNGHGWGLPIGVSLGSLDHRKPVLKPWLVSPSPRGASVVIESPRMPTFSDSDRCSTTSLMNAGRSVVGELSQS